MFYICLKNVKTAFNLVFTILKSSYINQMRFLNGVLWFQALIVIYSVYLNLIENLQLIYLFRKF